MAQYPALPLFTDAYLADTRHLTAAQHGAYLLLLMMAWRTNDCALPNDDAVLARWACMDKRTWSHNREVIMSFWHLCDDQKFRQGRLSDERKYVDRKRNINSANGQASALKRKERDLTTVQRNVNENSTPTPTPIERKEIPKGISKRKISKPDDVSQNVWDDFLEHRMAKKAPVTETVIRTIRAEAEKISWSIDQALTEMCARGWQGFKSEWVLNLKGKSNGTNQQTRQQRIDAALDRAWEKTGGGPDWKETPALGSDQTKLCGVQPVRQITGRS